MLDRYYSSQPIDGDSAMLDGSEAHHLLHVMRSKPGDQIIVFDGTGGEFQAEITECLRSSVKLSVGKRLDVERELACQITLAVALPKGDRQRWLVEKAVELGVARLIPLTTIRSVGEKQATKLDRYVVEASKQCGRNRLMEIAELVPWSSFLAQDQEREVCRLLADPTGTDVASYLDEDHDEYWIVVGPEGGFTDQELADGIEAGWNVVTCGERILRIETAALAVVSAIALR